MTKLGFSTTFLVGILVLVGAGFLILKSPKDAVPPPVVNPPVVNRAEFDKSFTLDIGEKVSFSDGLILSVKEINDSRCKPNVQCIWAGEIGVVLTLIGGNFKNAGEIRVGTTNNKSTTSNGYNFSLQSATEKNATLVVKHSEPATSDKCYIGGCSSQICGDQEGAISTCEYREEYACYKNAKCEKQSNGQCGWTETPSLKACLGVSL